MKTLVAVLSAALITLTACGTSDVSDENDGTLSAVDPWVKATDEDMTSMFGTLVNDTDEDIVITQAAAGVADMIELHEMVESDSGMMTMREKEGGFVIPAGGEYELAPGGDHFMLMALTNPLRPGDEVRLTLTAADGKTFQVTAIVKDFAGAEEEYEHGDHGDEHDHDGHDHDGHDHEGHAHDEHDS